MRILITKGRIVTSVGEQIADLLVVDGKIAAIGNQLEANAETTINAQGMLVLPGGIDPHVHLHLPTPAGFSSDDFHSGSIAALMGGTTTIIDFVTPSRGQSMVEALKARLDEAACSLVDYTFHVSPIEWNKNTPKEIEECIEMGFPSFKVYMAYKSSVGIDDNALYHVMHTVAQNGGMVTAHCEMGDDIDTLRDFYASQGLTAPKYHMLSRPPRFEALAVKRAIDLADQTQCPLYIVHVSAAESVKHIIQAQKSGQPLYAETCPQYLLLDEALYDSSLPEAIKYVISPPLRQSIDRDTLWNAINNGNILTVGTDHCPFSLEQKMVGKDDFRKIPNGAGGIEHRLALLYTFGALTGKLSLSKLVDVFATQPAKIFGLYPQKGELAIGTDADIVIWNPNVKGSISSSKHHSKSDISIYEGFETTGEVAFVIKNGIIAVDNGKLSENLPSGQLLKRRSTKTTGHYYKRMDNSGSYNCGRV
ncbi:dihydropyrimidinase [Tenuifilum sp.]|uniref:dihydropyrimidinase n=1 Tax=Tenuifilum sp. TaxID=2760880 RepID=UPI002BDEE81A|nr:dihydropyrimidinase [Tenuifilum sp.]HRS43204.1 dihydropyrimidinase [Tenuifilum sp.]